MIFKFSNNSTTTERRRTDEGFLDVPAMIYRSGLYRFHPSELVQDQIPSSLKSKPEIVLNVPDTAITDPEFLSSARARPVTFGHPDEFVNSKNAIRVSRGTTVGAAKVSRKPEGVYAGIDLRIFDSELIDRIESGEASEVSIGNSAELEYKPGERDGVKFDGVLDRIRINHIAVVKSGRAGHSVRLANEGEPMKPKADPKIDETDETKNAPATDETDETKNAPATEPPAIEPPAPEESAPVDVVAILDELRGVYAEITKKLSDLSEMVAAMKPAAEPPATETENAPPSVEVTNADVFRLVDERIAIINSAKQIAPGVEIGTKSNREIMVEVLKTTNAEFSGIVADKSDETVDALFRAAAVAFRVPESVSAGVALINAGTPAPKVDPVEQARRERSDRERDEFRRTNKI